MISCCSLLGVLSQCEGTGPKYCTPNGLGYTESKTKSSIPYLAPNGVFMLTFIGAFQAIDLIFAIGFSIWACILMKKIEKSDD